MLTYSVFAVAALIAPPTVSSTSADKPSGRTKGVLTPDETFRSAIATGSFAGAAIARVVAARMMEMNCILKVVMLMSLRERWILCFW